jgi:hypothetical protein
MDCTGYNEAINYNAPINYNGVCVTPVSTVIAGGFVNYRKPRNISDDDFAIVLATLELLDDD